MPLCVLCILTSFWVLLAPKSTHSFVHFHTFVVDFRREITEKGLKWSKKVENGWKKEFDQLLGACSTQKLVEIHSICVFKLENKQLLSARDLVKISNTFISTSTKVFRVKLKWLFFAPYFCHFMLGSLLRCFILIA